MKRTGLALLAVLIGLSTAACTGGGGGAGAAGGNDPGGGGFKELKACELLTLDDARQLIGADAENAYPDGSPVDRSVGDIALSLCQYGDADANHVVSVLVRAPLSESGARSNEIGFDTSLPAGARPVSGYGEKAYHDPNLGQLLVLARRVYLIFANGKGLNGSKHSLADMQKVADIVLPRLR